MASFLSFTARKASRATLFQLFCQLLKMHWFTQEQSNRIRYDVFVTKFLLEKRLVVVTMVFI